MVSNRIKLPENFIQQLTQLPETGMGYQRVKVILNNGQILLHHLVFNSSFLQLKEGENITPEQIQKIELEK